MYHFDKNNLYRLIDKGYSYSANRNKESVLMTGNGVIGIRGTFEEETVNQRRGTFLAGFYHKDDEGTSELVNVPDVIHMSITLNGVSFHLNSGLISAYERSLNTRYGYLERFITWTSPSQERFQLKFLRFVSMHDPYLVVSKVSITPLDVDTEITLETGIDATQTNEGKQHLVMKELRVFQHQHMRMSLVTRASHQPLIIDSTVNCTSSTQPSFTQSKNRLTGKYTTQTKQNETVTFSKYSRYSNRLIKDWMRQPINESVMYDEHEAAWNKKWEKANFAIEGPLKIVALFYASLYHIHAMTPWTSQISIGAKGLSGEGYNGHIFWDTEVFMLPFYTFTDVACAKNLLMYRLNLLHKAIENAKKRGFSGAMFPWESTLTGEDETPQFAAINVHTGKQTPIHSGMKELHISADIVFAMNQYILSTNDEDFLKIAKPLFFEVAKFFLSRLKKTEKGYELLDVIGPDEYTEHIDNNTFTNTMVLHCLEVAYAHADSVFKIELIEVINQLVIPPKTGMIIPQDDTFLSKQVIDISHYVSTAGTQQILKDYSRDEVNNIQVLKQADVLMLFQLFPFQYPPEIICANYEYYEPKTIHDSSLSKATHAIVASKCGLTHQAVSYFLDSLEMIDFHAKSASANGIHAAAMFGPFNILTQGFSGIYIDLEGLLHINPIQVDSLISWRFNFNYKGRLIGYQYHEKQITLTLLKGKPVMIYHSFHALELVDKTIIKIRSLV